MASLSDRDLSALERLAALHAGGMLSEEQYEAQKARLLEGHPNKSAFWLAVAVAIVVAIAVPLYLLRPGDAPIAPATGSDRTLTTHALQSQPAAPVGVPIPAATPVAPVADLPAGHGKRSTADPIAHDIGSVDGMKIDKSLRVAGKKVTLYRQESDSLFDNQYVLAVGGHAQVLETGALYSISAVGPFVILESDSGGTACPADFQIVDVSGERISKSFGTCSDLIKSHVATDGSLVSVVHSFNVGGPVTARYFRGNLTLWGQL